MFSMRKMLSMIFFYRNKLSVELITFVCRNFCVNIFLSILMLSITSFIKNHWWYFLKDRSEFFSVRKLLSITFFIGKILSIFCFFMEMLSITFFLRKYIIVDCFPWKKDVIDNFCFWYRCYRWFYRCRIVIFNGEKIIDDFFSKKGY